MHILPREVAICGVNSYLDKAYRVKIEKRNKAIAQSDCDSPSGVSTSTQSRRVKEATKMTYEIFRKFFFWRPTFCLGLTLPAFRRLVFFSLFSLSLSLSSFFYSACIFRLNIHERRNGGSFDIETNLFRKFHLVRHVTEEITNLQKLCLKKHIG